MSLKDSVLNRKFRSKCVEMNIREEDAISQAIRLWLKSQEKINDITRTGSIQIPQDLGLIVAKDSGKGSKKK